MGKATAKAPELVKFSGVGGAAILFKMCPASKDCSFVQKHVLCCFITFAYIILVLPAMSWELKQLVLMILCFLLMTWWIRSPMFLIILGMILERNLWQPIITLERQ
ncbi:uncharacterized protein LOC133822300 isoform X1 [Humulus lupulus]|uniref:uncharacterized protein LOC133822300 isoform X1 n=1 Tax=Humulus lupulus TaxID=3486 RepID=UPI002B4114BF|nr:uncharacterized protein LOC133822300 isoform X1 [Humulus lupulus]